MTEATLTSRFLLRLRELGCYVIKHHDVSTRGVPDASVSKIGRTWWLEFKLQRVKVFTTMVDFSRLLDKSDLVQLETMVALERATQRRALYIVFQVVGNHHQVLMVLPSLVKLSYFDKEEVLVEKYVAPFKEGA